MNVDFTPKGHPRGVELTSTQKMIHLRLEKMYLEMSREITEYLAPNGSTASAIEKLFESREYAIKSVLSGESSGTRGETVKKDAPLVADGYPGVTAKNIKKPEVKSEEKSETQKACQEINVHESKKASAKKRGRPAKTVAS